MRKDEQETLARAMGRLEGLVEAMRTTTSEHIKDDSDKFHEILARFDELSADRLMDLQQAMTLRREANRWKTTLLAGLGGAILTGLIGIVGQIIIFNMRTGTPPGLPHP